MGYTTAISWTDATHNFWYGCKKVSQGCRACYAEREMKRYGRDFHAVTRAKGFAKPLQWREPRRVFTCSWSDFFIEEADPWRDEAWAIIKKTPHLTYQICTKRPGRIREHLPADWGEGYPNVWMGITTETQEMFDERWAILRQIPASIQWLSIEPMLGAIDLDMIVKFIGGSIGIKDSKPNWVIVGGESGANFRPMNLNWARSIREQCRLADVPFFYKQNSDTRPGQDALLDGVEYHQFPACAK